MKPAVLLSLALMPGACADLMPSSAPTSPDPTPVQASPVEASPSDASPAATGVRGIGEETVFGDTAFRAATEVQGAAFAPDGSWLLTQDYWGVLQQWSIPDGRLLGELPSPCESPSMTRWGLDVSPDGKWLAIPCEGENLTVADLRTAEVRLVVPGDANNVAWSADGDSLVASYDDGARLIDPTTGEVRRHWSGDNATTVSAGRDRVALITLAPGADPDDYYADHLLRVVDGAGAEQWTAAVSSGPVRFSADGRRLWVTVDEESTVAEYDVATGKRLDERSLETSAEGLAPAGDGVWVAQGGELQRLSADLQTQGLTRQAGGRLVASRDGSLMAVLDRARTPVYRANGEPLHHVDGMDVPAETVLVSADGSVMVAVSSDAQVVVIDRASGEERALGLQDDWLEYPTLTADGATLAVNGDVLKLVDVGSGQVRTVRGAEDLSIYFLAFAPGGEQLLALAEDMDQSHLVVIDVAQALVRTQKPLGPSASASAALSADGRTLVVPHNDGRLRLIPLLE